MTESELVDFAIEQIGARDDWHVWYNGHTLVGTVQNPARYMGDRFYVGMCSGTGTGVRVGEVDIEDEKEQGRLIEAVEGRARELQRAAFSLLVKQPPEHETRNKRNGIAEPKAEQNRRWDD